MNRIIGIVLICTIYSMLSCNSQNSIEISTILTESKKEVKRNIDSANFYFDHVIVEHNNGAANDLLLKMYGNKIEQIETNIDQVLERLNMLGKEEKITQQEYEAWLKEIDLSSVMEKHEKIRKMGVDFNQLPVTNFYKLGQLYVDSINNFSMNFPNDWIVLNNYQDYTLMSSGPINEDISSKMKREGGFGLSISVFKKSVSTKEYYQGNLKSIKQEYKDIKILEERDIDLNGIPAIYVAHQCTINDMLITSIQVYFFNDNKGYVLNGSATSEDFEQYRDLYIEIARTFSLSGK